jgi:hypothetical protein
MTVLNILMMPEPIERPDDVIPVTDVMARWAYTEAIGAHSSTCYTVALGGSVFAAPSFGRAFIRLEMA